MAAGGVANSVVDTQATTVWSKTCATLKRELGEATFGSWLGQAVLRERGDELCLVAATGIRILGNVDFRHNRYNAMIVAVSIGVGMVPLIAPNFRQWMPHAIHPLIESGILLASICAVALNMFFNGAKHDEAAIVAAARQADAH